MKSALINLVAALVRQLIGSELWSLVVIAVASQEDKPTSGEEKRETVINSLRPLTSTVASWLVNLTIETVVAKMKVAK